MTGCESADKGSDFPKAEATPPAALLAVVEVPSATELPRMVALAGSVNPKLGAMAKTLLPAQISRALGESVESVDGLDLDGPIRLFVVDPKLAKPPIVVVVGKKGAIKAKTGLVVVPVSDKVVAIGTAKAIAVIDNYAAHVIAGKVEAPRVVGFPSSIMATFKDQIDAFPAKLKSLSMISPAAGWIDAEVNFLKTLGADTETVTLAVAGDEADPYVRFEIKARPNTVMAKWFALQEPSKFALEDRLPAFAGVSFFVDGTIHAGALAQALIDFTEKMLGGTGARLDDMAASFAQFMNIATGDFAMVLHVDITRAAMALGAPMWSAVGIYGVTDADKAAQTMTGMFSAMSGTRTIMGMEQTNRTEAAAFEQAGVSVTHHISEMSAIPGSAQAANPMFASGKITQEAYIAGFDGAVVYALGQGSEARMRAAIDHAKSGGPGYVPTAAVNAAIAQAKKDKASLVMTMDLPAMGAPVPPMAMSVIFSKRSATLTFRFVH